MERAEVARLFLIGPPRLETLSGEKVEIASKKAWALLAMLATSNRCERSRVWLQQMLWGARGQKQAQSSLRRELSNLRGLLERAGLSILECDHRNVRLQAERVKIDFLEKTHTNPTCDFLEGIDLVGEEEFEDWLREIRASLDNPFRHTALPDLSPSSSANLALKPHVAVMPPKFDEDTPGAREFAIRTVRALSESLTRLRWLPIVDIGNFDPDVPSEVLAKVISERLSARYLVKIEVLGNGSERAVSIALLEMPSHVIRWSETRHIAEPTDDTEFELEIARTVNCLSASFDMLEQRDILRGPPPPAHDCGNVTSQIRVLISQLSESELKLAEHLLINASTNHNAQSELTMLRASLAIWQHWVGRKADRDDAQLSFLIRTAIRTDPSDARGHFYLGIFDTWNGRLQSARQHLQHACGLDPSSAEALTHLGTSYYLAGDPASALSPLRRALFISPLDPKRFVALGELAMTLWMLRQYEEALDFALQIQGSHPDYVLAHVIETASYSATGRLREARESRARTLERQPHLYQEMLDWLPFHDKQWADRIRSAVEFEPIESRSNRSGLMGHIHTRRGVAGS